MTQSPDAPPAGLAGNAAAGTALSIRAVLPIALLWIAFCTFGWRSMTQAPGGDATTSFTAKAGMATLSELLQEQAPHPVGSQLHDVVRDRILATLRAAGYEPTLDASWQCAAQFGCAWVQNIAAVRKGTDSTRAVMVSAHYDSVPAGPGVSDDGAGVAVLLELAKELARRPVPRNDVFFFISDGEELGVFGAQGFVNRHPDMKRIPVMVNLEARGTSGPSVMFETGAGNAQLMQLYARAVTRPVANSLAFEIYKRLPNGTDFTVYRDHGVIGFNHAFIGSASRYHTPIDDLAHLDQRTLQHHGDNAFALVSALAAADLSSLTSPTDASYFDVFGRLLVQWPAQWNLPISAAALLGVLLLLVIRRRQLGGAPRAIGWSLLALLLPVALSAGLGYGLAYPLGHWPGALQLDHPMPWPGRVALLFGAVLVALLTGAIVARRGAVLIATLAVWLTIGALATFLAFKVPGASYALQWPAAAFAVAAIGLLLVGRPDALFWASALGFTGLAFFWTGHSMMFESALGFSQSMIKMILLVPLTWAAVPMVALSFGRPGARAALPILLAAAGMIAGAAAAALVPATTPDCPRGINIMYQDDGAGPPRWVALGVDERPNPRMDRVASLHEQAYLDAAGFLKEPHLFYLLGEFAHAGRAKPAAELHLPPPTFAPTPPAETASATDSAGRRVVTGVLRLPADSLGGGLAIGPHSGLAGLRVDGQQVWTAADLADGRPRRARLAGVAGKDLAVELTLEPGAKGPILVYQRMPLPEAPEVNALRSKRPADATPFGYGDTAIVIRKLPL